MPVCFVVERIILVSIFAVINMPFSLLLNTAFYPLAVLQLSWNRVPCYLESCSS